MRCDCGSKQFICAICGQVYEESESDLPDREQKALKALRAAIQRNGGRHGTTLAVALDMGYSIRWACEFLRRLEDKGYVHRPDGPRSGWAVVKEHEHMAIELVRAA
jgi:Mn-dependent DtxR family transcriptional regulator